METLPVDILIEPESKLSLERDESKELITIDPVVPCWLDPPAINTDPPSPPELDPPTICTPPPEEVPTTPSPPCKFNVPPLATPPRDAPADK